MAEPVDLIVPMLREMRARMDTSFDEVKAMIAALDRRMGAMESRQDSGALERKVCELEHPK